jgi:hypothetical protein
VRAVLEGSPYVKEDSLGVTPTERAGVPHVIYGWQGRGKMLNRVYVREGKVFHIKLTLDYKLTLGEAVQEFGHPESVRANVVSLERRCPRDKHPESVEGCGARRPGVFRRAQAAWAAGFPTTCECTLPETVYAHLDGNGGYSVVFEYPTQGLTLDSYTWPEDNVYIAIDRGVGPVSEEMLVTWVSYYAPTSLECALRDVFLFGPAKVAYFMDHAQDWDGFGPVSLTEIEHW